MADAVTAPPASAAVPTPITETPEFKEALAKEREVHRLNLEAEYRRKTQELEARYAPAATPQTPGTDFFQTWGEKHGLPAEAGRELVQGVVGYIDGQLLPERLKPISEASKRQELRSQRADVRASKPKLALLDDRFHAEVMSLLNAMDPRLIGPDSYARALHMVIGQNIEALESEHAKRNGEAVTREAEPAPGVEPLPSSAPTKPSKVPLNAKQQQFCEEKDFTPEEFVEMMRDRARKLELQGLSKVQVRGRLGDLLGTIEF